MDFSFSAPASSFLRTGAKEYDIRGKEMVDINIF
jgi:hypothetical protein